MQPLHPLAPPAVPAVTPGAPLVGLHLPRKKGCAPCRDVTSSEMLREAVERAGPSTHISSPGPWATWPPGRRLAQGKAGKLAQMRRFTEEGVTI